MSASNTAAHLIDWMAERVRSRVRPGSRLGMALRAVRRRLPRRTPDQPIPQVISAYARHHPKAFVVVVGAHDGTGAHDPLREELLRRPWRGILVEPVPHVFERLRKNYQRKPGIILENAAISDENSIRDFHFLPETDDPSVWKWYDTLGSFRRDVVLRHREFIPDIEERIVTAPVPCLTFESLCEKHRVSHVDVVQIDAEGYDYEVLRLIDLDRFRPSLVMYEHIHLEDTDRAAAEKLLRHHGYLCLSDNMDTVAIHESTLRAFEDLGDLWGQLTPSRQEYSE